MATPKLYPLNIIETSTVTVPGEAAGFEQERLYDRHIDARYKDSASGTRIYKADQGATLIQAIDAWGLFGHNLSGVSCTLESSPDDSVWTLRDTFTPTAADFLRTSLTGGLLTVRYWRLTPTSAPSAPEIGEWVLTRVRTVTGGYLAEPGMADARVPNVARSYSRAGKGFRASRGAERWRALYPLADITAADKTELLAAVTEAKGGAKPFPVLDADGTLRWAEWLIPDGDGLEFIPVPVNRSDVDLDLLEAL